MDMTEEEEYERSSLADLVRQVLFAFADAATCVAANQGTVDGGIDLHFIGVDLYQLAEDINRLLPDQIREFEDSEELKNLVLELKKTLSVEDKDFEQVQQTVSPSDDHHDPESTIERVLKAILCMNGAEQQKRLYEKRQTGETIRERVENLIQKVEFYVPLSDELEYDFIEKDIEIPLPEYPNHVNKLFYNAILPHMLDCGCERQGEQGHWVMLRLKAVPETVQKDHVCFDTIFSASIKSTIRWQDAKVAVPMSNESKNKVRFSIDLGTKSPSLDSFIFWRKNDQSSNIGQNSLLNSSKSFTWLENDGDNEAPDIERCITQHGLCRMIEVPCGACLRLKVTTGRLNYFLGGVRSEQNIYPDRALRLDEIIRTRNLMRRGRSLLAFTIAKSVWQFYNSEWMDTVWTRFRIFFLEELVQGVRKLYCKPYLSAKFKETTIRHLEFRQSKSANEESLAGSMHHYPIVLGLGITLLEIAQSKPLDPGESDESDESDENLESLFKLRNAQSINKLHARGMEELRQLKLEGGKHAQLFKRVIGRCFDPYLFQDIGFMPGNTEKDFETRRRRLYNEIVRPLKELKDTAMDGCEMEYLELIPLARQPTSQEMHHSHAHTPSSSSIDKRGKTTKHGDFLVLNESKIRSPKEWKARVIDLVEKLDLLEPERPIKVAILDTGCASDAPIFRQNLKDDHIKGWKDFAFHPAPGKSHMVDNHGHGTHIVTILMELAPSASIYVARVAQDERSLCTAEASVAKAIEHATSHWEVDIVSMSFGFNETLALVEAQIRKCGEGTTFFAAASNDGLNEKELFPACLPRVISIRGTDILGDLQQRFNPRSQGEVFATLATDVPSNWIGKESERAMSGCSVATPIAVAVSILLLDYITDNFPPEFVDRSKTTEGIKRILRTLSSPNPHQHSYIAPFVLFNQKEVDLKATLRHSLNY